MRRIVSFTKDFGVMGSKLLNEVFTDDKYFHVNSFILSNGKIDFNEFKMSSYEEVKLFFYEIFSKLPKTNTSIFWFSEGAMQFYPGWLEKEQFSHKKILRLGI